MKITYRNIPYQEDALQQTKQACRAEMMKQVMQPAKLETHHLPMMVSMLTKEHRFFFLASGISTILVFGLSCLMSENAYIYITYSLFQSILIAYSIYLYSYYMEEILHPTVLSKAKKFLYRMLILHTIEAIYLTFLYIASPTQLSLYQYLLSSILPFLICTGFTLVVQRLSNQLSILVCMYSIVGFLSYISYDFLSSLIISYINSIIIVSIIIYLVIMYLLYRQMRREDTLCYE